MPVYSSSKGNSPTDYVPCTSLIIACLILQCGLGVIPPKGENQGHFHCSSTLPLNIVPGASKCWDSMNEWMVDGWGQGRKSADRCMHGHLHACMEVSWSPWLGDQLYLQNYLELEKVTVKFVPCSPIDNASATVQEK